MIIVGDTLVLQGNWKVNWPIFDGKRKTTSTLKRNQTSPKEDAPNKPIT